MERIWVYKCDTIVDTLVIYVSIIHFNLTLFFLNHIFYHVRRERPGLCAFSKYLQKFSCEWYGCFCIADNFDPYAHFFNKRYFIFNLSKICFISYLLIDSLLNATNQYFKRRKVIWRFEPAFWLFSWLLFWHSNSEKNVKHTSWF